MYLSDNATIFLTVYFVVHLLFFVIITSEKFSEQKIYLTKIALIWYVIAGFIYIPLLSRYVEDLVWIAYPIYFLIIGTTVFISLVTSTFYKKNKSFLFSFAYLIPGIFSIFFLLANQSGKSLRNLAAEPFFCGIATSIIYSLDYRFGFSKKYYRVIAILLCIFISYLIAIFTPGLPE
jgi:hypothetical protein